MKRNIVFALVMGALALSFVSCKKDYQCHCKKTSNAGEDHFTVNERKKNAAAACESIKNNNPSLYSSCEPD